MSEDRPEVGDVWLNEASLECHLFGQIGDYFNMVKSNERRKYVELDVSKIDVTKWKYLGKSKASIKDLFEVSDINDAQQNEIERLREALQNIINATNLWLPKGGLKVDTPYMMNMRALNETAEKALNGESEEK